MRRVWVTVAATLMVAPALAMMAPQYYEAARSDAPNVIIIAVETVDPPGSDGFGLCGVHGTVEEVERGTKYKAGDAVTIDVDCAETDAQVPVGGTIWQDAGTLGASGRGRAYLNDDGDVMLSQYEIIE